MDEALMVGNVMRVRLQIAAIFIAVGLGALTVTLLHDPMALIPHPPYGPWISARLLVLSSLAALGILLVFGVVDDRTDFDDTDHRRDRAIFWRAVGLAFLISVLASATFVAVSAFVEHLDTSGRRMTVPREPSRLRPGSSRGAMPA